MHLTMPNRSLCVMLAGTTAVVYGRQATPVSTTIVTVRATRAADPGGLDPSSQNQFILLADPTSSYLVISFWIQYLQPCEPAIGAGASMHNGTMSTTLKNSP